MRHSIISPLAALGALVGVGCSGGGDATSPTPPSLAVPAPAPSTSAPQSETDVVYGSGLTNGSSKTLLLDVYQSGDACTAPRPAVVLIHGGGFRTGSKTVGAFPDIAEDLADQGYVAISINYRLEGDDPVPSAEFTPYLNAFITGGGGAGVPGLVQVANNISSAVEDAVTAIRWIETNASDRCVDVDRIALWGSSAGAVIAVNVAYAMDDFSIDARKPAVVIDYWGQLIFDDTIEAGDPPLLILHGDEDPTVRYDEALRLEAEALAVDLPHSFYTVLEAGHGFSAIPISSVTVDGVSILDVTFAFLEAHLLDGTPEYETRSVPLSGG